MSDNPTSPAPVVPTTATAATPTPATPSSGFVFCDPGCRTDVRLGVLLMVAAVFLWLFLGPTMSSRIYLLGVPLLLIGIPLQTIQARRYGRPGYPWKLGLVLTLGGACMCFDLRYREVIGGTVQVQEIAPLLCGAGIWILLWWPWARPRAGVATMAKTQEAA